MLQMRFEGGGIRNLTAWSSSAKSPCWIMIDTMKSGGTATS
ncbi:MAG: hypothetical protein U0361_05545 [Nitrospiraceae bacterium]